MKQRVRYHSYHGGNKAIPVDWVVAVPERRSGQSLEESIMQARLITGRSFTTGPDVITTEDVYHMAWSIVGSFIRRVS